MKITILGSGGPIPDANRAGPATLVQVGGLNLLFDAGRGVMLRLAAAGIGSPAFLHRVFLTHLHSDHVTDFNDLVTTRWTMSPVPNPLPVTGPPGTAAFADRTIAMLTADIGYRIAHHADLNEPPACTTTEVLDGVAFEHGDVRVIAMPTDHRPVEPTIGFRIEAEGRVVVIAGDTVPCEGLDKLCIGADLYVQTVIRPDSVRAIPSPRLQDIHDYHSSIADAGRTAERAGVRALVLNHMVPTPVPGTEHEWIAEATAEFTGDVVMSADLMAFDL